MSEPSTLTAIGDSTDQIVEQEWERESILASLNQRVNEYGADLTLTSEPNSSPFIEVKLTHPGSYRIIVTIIGSQIEILPDVKIIADSRGEIISVAEVNENGMICEPPHELSYYQGEGGEINRREQITNTFWEALRTLVFL